jgi:hypothetical protein
MNEPTIICPACKQEIRLTESLAAPLIASTRKEYEARIAQRDADIQKREAALRQEQARLAKAQESVDEQVAARVKVERAAIAESERKKARDALRDELDKAREEMSATEALLKERDAKLAEARKTELDLRKQREQLQEEKDRFELDKQRAIDAERAKIRATAQKDADDQARLKLAEKDKTIGDLQAKLQEALRKAEQGSQQLQGEIQELELEALLRGAFPRDVIEPVAKGEYGGDVLHRVIDPYGRRCGAILWESKRTKNWSDGWLGKLREDQRAAVARFLDAVSPESRVD